MKRALLPVVLAACACADPAADPDPGLHLGLRVLGAQLVRGPLAAANGGPAVTLVERPEPRVTRGQSDIVIKGRLAEGGQAVHVQLEGDPDHWVKAATIFDDVIDTQLLWSATIELSRDIQTSSTVRVFVQGADAAGLFGEPSSTTFELLSDPPPSMLTVGLAWDRPADLDLHLVTPEGIDINPKNINSYEPPPPGMFDPPDAWRSGAMLDFDSNQECRIDGRQIERIAFQRAAPAPGTYRVFANIFASCGQTAANFRAVVLRDGIVVKQASGTIFEFDARMQPRDGEAPGLFVTEFQVE